MKRLLQAIFNVLRLSHHPCAPSKCASFAKRHLLGSRIWEHAILPLHTILQAQLPRSVEHYLAFYYETVTYLMLIIEFIPGIAPEWIELLGDIAVLSGATKLFDDQGASKVCADNYYEEILRFNDGLGRLYYKSALHWSARCETLLPMALLIKSFQCRNASDVSPDKAMNTLQNIYGSRIEQSHDYIFYTVQLIPAFYSFHPDLDSMIIESVKSFEAVEASNEWEYIAVLVLSAYLNFGDYSSRSYQPYSRGHQHELLADEILQRIKRLDQLEASCLGVQPTDSAYRATGISDTTELHEVSQKALYTSMTLTHIALSKPAFAAGFIQVWLLFIVLNLETDAIQKTILPQYPWSEVCKYVNNIEPNPALDRYKEVDEKNLTDHISTFFSERPVSRSDWLVRDFAWSHKMPSSVTYHYEDAPELELPSLCKDRIIELCYIISQVRFSFL